METWSLIQQGIQNCRLCEVGRVQYLRVPHEEKCKPKHDPLLPVQLYFVLVAPPWGGAYFWDETKRDAVRDGLFATLPKLKESKVRNCLEFRNLRFYLTPAVKCPSEKGKKDYRPSRLAIRNCSNFLKDELFAAKPERILAMGKVPFQSLCDLFNIKAPQKVAEYRKNFWWVRIGAREIPMSGTYFPGNNRHKGFSAIIEDISAIREIKPRDT